jgi:M6 family metalloprotease-like protein
MIQRVLWLAAIGAAASCGDKSPTGSVPTTGSLAIATTGLPAGASPSITVTGPGGFNRSVTADGTLASLTPGSYTVAAATVVFGGSLYSPAPASQSVTVTAGSTATATIAYSGQPIPADCRLPARFPDLGLGFPRALNRQKVIGDVRAATLFVDFSDAPATRAPQSVFSILSPTAENYFRAISYGRMNLIFQPSFVWRRMSRPSNSYGWNALTFALHRAYIQEALDLAQAVDFSQSDVIVIISNPDAGTLNNGPAFLAAPGSGVTAGGRTFLNAVTSGRDLINWGGYWLNHEMGHTMGLPDLYAFTGAGHRFVGGFSLMGLISGHSREFFGWERWLLGWIDDAQVTCAPQGTSETVLSPVERAGGTKIVVMPTGPNTAVVAESRRAEGFDTNGPLSPGVLVYFIDTSIASGTGVLKVLPINDADTNKSSAPLQPGGSLTFAGVTVTFVSQDASGDRVRVVR